MAKGITVAELYKDVKFLMSEGCGDKVVLISDDDEGNGFHTLFYLFAYKPEDVKPYASTFPHRNDPDDVVLLG